MAIKNAILIKKIGSTVYDLYVKTSAAQVVFGNSTVDAALTTLNGDATTAGSVAKSIADALGTMTVASTTYNTVAAYGAAILTAAEGYADTKIGSLVYEETTYGNLRAAVDAMIADVEATFSAAFIFKGVVDYVSDLPAAASAEAGWVYQVRYRGSSGTDPLNAEYAFDGTNWVELGSIVDLSAYSTTTQMNAAIDLAIAQAMGLAGQDRGTTTTLSQIADFAGTMVVGATTYTTVSSYVEAVKTAALGTMQVGSTSYTDVGSFVNAALGTMEVGSTSYNTVASYGAAILSTAEGYTDTKIGSLNYTPAGGSATDYPSMRALVNAMINDVTTSTGKFISGTTAPSPSDLTENDLFALVSDPA